MQLVQSFNSVAATARVCWDDRQTPTSHRPARLAGKTQRKEVRERSKETQGWAGNRAPGPCKCWGSAGVAGWAQRWEKKIKMGGSLPAAANCKWTLLLVPTARPGKPTQEEVSRLTARVGGRAGAVECSW